MTRATDYKDPRLEICRAAQRTDIMGVRWELKQGADPDIIDIDGKTALIHAAARGRNNIVKLLISHGVNLEARDDGGDTALSCATRLGYTETAQILTAAIAEAPILARRKAEQEAEEKRVADETAFWKNLRGKDLTLHGRCGVKKPLRLKKSPRP